MRRVSSCAVRQRGIDRVAEAVDDGVDLRRVDDVGRREDHVVAALAVDRAAHRVAGQAAREGLALHPLVQLQRRVEDRLASRGRRTNSTAQNRPRPRMSPTWRWLPKRSVSARLQPRAHGAARSPAARPRDHLLHRQRRGAGDRMRLVGVAVQEGAAAGGERLDDAAVRPGCRRSAGSRRRGPSPPPGCRA